MNPQGLAARWPVRPLDIDPFRLPAHFALDVCGTSGQAPEARDLIIISPDAVAVEREVPGARTVRETLAADAFSGVAVHMELYGEDERDFAISVNLHHEDPRLCIPLHMAFDMDGVGARCQSWARALRLPLLLPARDGTWCELGTRLGRLTVGPPSPRSPRLLLATRRSLTASLRQVGMAKDRGRIRGAEITARH